MPAPADRDRRDLGPPGPALGADETEIDDLESGDLLLLATVEDLEIVLGQAANRRTIADDVDGHFDGDHRGRAAEPALGQRSASDERRQRNE